MNALYLTTLVVMNLSLAAVDDAAKDKVDASKPCFAAKEYITVISYLRDDKSFEIQEEQARKIAERVSDGCEGAAERFIRTVSVLRKAEVSARDALEMGVQVSHKHEVAGKAFVEIFSVCFSEDHLDLDLKWCSKLAKDLTVDFQGDIPVALSDFKNTVDYCISKSDMNLPRQECAKIAQKVAVASQIAEQSMYKDFKRVVEFIKGQSELGKAPVPQIAQMALDVLNQGRSGADNFVSGYKFALADSGLKLTPDQALSFARQMASKKAKAE